MFLSDPYFLWKVYFIRRIKIIYPEFTVFKERIEDICSLMKDSKKTHKDSVEASDSILKDTRIYEALQLKYINSIENYFS